MISTKHYIERIPPYKAEVASTHKGNTGTHTLFLATATLSLWGLVFYSFLTGLADSLEDTPQPNAESVIDACNPDWLKAGCAQWRKDNSQYFYGLGE